MSHKLSEILGCPLNALPQGFRISLWNPGEEVVPENYTDKPFMSIHLAPKPCGKGLLLIPGGGYYSVCDTFEGEERVPYFLELGITVFVLRYRHSPKHYYPAPQQDASEAMAIIRANAEEWGIRQDKIGILGFSAGGHLSSVISTQWDRPEFRQETKYPDVCTRPDFAVLVYPVINLNRLTSYDVTGKFLLGEAAPEERIQEFCSETRVTEHTPPTFLFTMGTDTVVPCENSIAYYQALRAKGVPAQLHVYDTGHHGISFGAAYPQTAGWPLVLKDWLNNSV